MGKQHVKPFLGAAWRKACPPGECFQLVKDSTSEDKGGIKGGRWMAEDGMGLSTPKVSGESDCRLVWPNSGWREPDIGKGKKNMQTTVKSKLKVAFVRVDGSEEGRAGKKVWWLFRKIILILVQIRPSLFNRRRLVERFDIFSRGGRAGIGDEVKMYRPNGWGVPLCHWGTVIHNALIETRIRLTK